MSTSGAPNAAPPATTTSGDGGAGPAGYGSRSAVSAASSRGPSASTASVSRPAISNPAPMAATLTANRFDAASVSNGPERSHPHRRDAPTGGATLIASKRQDGRGGASRRA